MKISILSLLLAVMLVTDCGPSQKITGSWDDPDFKSKGPYKKAFVIVMTQNKNANYIIETQIAKTLSER
ncbi:MAG: hypothetical protein HZB98_14310, partial [Bacteroidia bacterium]|nr:hypothetical protein [Bacteroidia bacterium]